MMDAMRPNRTGTYTSRGQFKTTRQYIGPRCQGMDRKCTLRSSRAFLQYLQIVGRLHRGAIPWVLTMGVCRRSSHWRLDLDSQSVRV